MTRVGVSERGGVGRGVGGGGGGSRGLRRYMLERLGELGLVDLLKGLGDEARAQLFLDLPPVRIPFRILGQFRCLFPAGDGADARVGKAGGNFLGEALDAGTAGGEARLCAAIGTFLGDAAGKAAMVASQSLGLAMLDQPGGA